MTTRKEPPYNPHAFETISILLIDLIKKFNRKHNFKSFKPIVLEQKEQDVFNIDFLRKSKYTKEHISAEYLLDLKTFLTEQLNIDVRIENSIIMINVIPYVYDADTLDTEFKTISEVIEPELSFEASLLKHGKITPIRYGYVAGIPNGHDVYNIDNREIIIKDNASVFYNTQHSIMGVAAKADEVNEIGSRIKRDPHSKSLNQAIWGENIPDIVAENYWLNLCSYKETTPENIKSTKLVQDTSDFDDDIPF